MRLTTRRLLLANVTNDDLDGLLAVALSNPEFLATHEGSDGDPGGFNRDMLERDLSVAALDPARHPLSVRLRDTDEVVGWAEVLDEHPQDRLPWIGLLEIHADRHRQGLATEAAAAIVGWARDRGAAALRLGVDDRNDAAAAFWATHGFFPVDQRQRASPLGTLGVTVLEQTF